MGIAQKQQVCRDLVKEDEKDEWFTIDVSNPSVPRTNLLETICRTCKKWFPSQVMMKEHRKRSHPRQRHKKFKSRETKIPSFYI